MTEKNTWMWWYERQNSGNHPIRTTKKLMKKKKWSNIWDRWDNMQGANIHMLYRLFRRRERKRSKKCTSEHYDWNLSKPKEGNISRYRKHVHACSICVTLCNPLDDSLPGSPSVQELPRQECWNGLPFPTPVDLPDLMIEPASPALAGRFFSTVPPGKSRGSQSKMNPNRPIPRHIIMKRAKVEERILKTTRERVIYRGIPTRHHLIAESMLVRKEQHNIFKVQTEKNVQPSTLYPERLLFKREWERSCFSDKQNLKEFSNTKLPLKEMFPLNEKEARI